MPANTRDLQGGQHNQKNYSKDGTIANAANVKTKQVCYEFMNKGSCSKKNCKFEHKAAAAAEDKVPKAAPGKKENAHATVKPCTKWNRQP